MTFAVRDNWSAGQVVPTFTAWNIIGEGNLGSTGASARFNINPDGTISSAVTAFDGGSLTGSPNWYSPTNTGVGGSCYVKFTPTAGTPYANTASTWTSLATQQNISVYTAATSGSNSCTFTMQIATDAAGTHVVLTSTGNVVQYLHA